MPAKRILIVGGGISGLTIAYRLTKLTENLDLKPQITLLEASSRLGGIIETLKQDDFVIESGPDSFISDKPWAFDLVKELGLSDELIETQSEFRQSFILKNKKLIPVPKGLYLTAPTDALAFLKSPLVSFFGKLRALAEPIIKKKNSEAEESIASFVRRRFGNDVYEQIAQPMFAGIYSGDPEKLSLQATFPKFAQIEEEFGSILRGLKRKQAESADSVSKSSGPRYGLFLSLKNGMERLIHALHQEIAGIAVHLNSEVKTISKSDVWKVQTIDNRNFEADLLCLALPAHISSRLITTINSDLSHSLHQIPYAPMMVVTQAFHKLDVGHPLDGFGFVVPKTENSKILGCSFLSQKFKKRAPEGYVLLRTFLGGLTSLDLMNTSDAELEALVLKELSVLGLKTAPIFTKIKRSSKAMPQYTLGHLDRLTQIRELAQKTPDLFLSGNFYEGVGLPDTIHHANKTAESIYQMICKQNRVAVHG